MEVEELHHLNAPRIDCALLPIANFDWKLKYEGEEVTCSFRPSTQVTARGNYVSA